MIVRRTLALVCDGLHRKQLTLDLARALVDDLRSQGGARFPCDSSTFVSWAERNGLFAAE